jgi:hypothetical protein
VPQFPQILGWVWCLLILTELLKAFIHVEKGSVLLISANCDTVASAVLAMSIALFKVRLASCSSNFACTLGSLEPKIRASTIGHFPNIPGHFPNISGAVLGHFPNIPGAVLRLWIVDYWNFHINYIKYDTPVVNVQNVVSEELKGPGGLLGKKIVHGARHSIPRDLVNAVMYNLDPDALEEREPRNKGKRKRGQFITHGVNWSLDGHDKLMGFQNWTFPLAIYGCYDTASRKVMFLKVWTSNSNPELVGRWYFDHLYETKRISSIIRLDRGTETGVLASIHVFLRRNHGVEQFKMQIAKGYTNARWNSRFHTF